MLIVSSIRLMLDLSVFRVPRPCLYMLGSSSQPKCFACVNLAYTHCMRTLESITPDHHVVLRNNEPSQRCTVRGNTFLKLLWGIILFTTVVLSKQDAKHDKHHMQSNNKSDMIWPLSSCAYDVHRRGVAWSPWSPAWHHDLHHRVFMTLTRQLLLLLLWLTRFSNKVK